MPNLERSLTAAQKAALGSRWPSLSRAWQSYGALSLVEIAITACSWVLLVFCLTGWSVFVYSWVHNEAHQSPAGMVGLGSFSLIGTLLLAAGTWYQVYARTRRWKIALPAFKEFAEALPFTHLMRIAPAQSSPNKTLIRAVSWSRDWEHSPGESQAEQEAMLDELHGLAQYFSTQH